MKNRIYFKPSFYDLILIGFMSALATGLKPIFAIISRLIKSSLSIPGGSLIGGLYFIALIMGRELSKYAFVAFFIGLIQAILMTTLGLFGTNGFLSLISFSMPGLMIDLIYFIIKYQKSRIILSTIFANIAGLTIVLRFLDKFTFNLIFLYLAISFISTFFCGLLNYYIVKNVTRILSENNLMHLK